MLGRFGYECPATGFAFEVGRVLLAMETQGTAVDLPGPDFFIIDFTPEKTRALALSRRFRDLGRAVARDIISRPLEESLAYARQQRARWALVIGDPGAPDAEAVRVLDLDGGGERSVAMAALLESPAGYFPVFGGGGHA
jgi:ATP phosphoribosyltransferase regulatory subunit